MAVNDDDDASGWGTAPPSDGLALVSILIILAVVIWAIVTR